MGDRIYNSLNRDQNSKEEIWAGKSQPQGVTRVANKNDIEQEHIIGKDTNPPGADVMENEGGATRDGAHFRGYSDKNVRIAD